MAGDAIAAMFMTGITALAVGFAAGLGIGHSENPTKEEIEILQGYGFRVGEHELRERLKKLAGAGDKERS